MSIRHKITLPAITVAVVSVLAVLIVVSFVFSAFVDDSVYSQVDIYADVLQSQLEVYQDKARLAAMAVAADDSIQRMTERRNREALVARTRTLQQEIGVDFITVTDETGAVIARSYDPENYGDNIANQQTILAALSGMSESHIEQGTSIQLATRAGSPIYDGRGELVGAISTGHRLDTNDFVDKMKALTECEVTVFLRDTRISTTVTDESGVRAVGTTADEAISQQVLGGEPYSGPTNLMGNAIYAVYLPIQDSNGDNVGMLFAGRYTGSKQAVIANFAFRGGLVGLLLLVVAVPFMIVLGKRITAPIHDMVKAAQSLATGNVDVTVNASTNDEMKDLAEAFNSMIASTRQQASVIERIAGGDLSGYVMVRSTHDVVGKALSTMLDHNNDVFQQITDVAQQVSIGSEHVADGAQSLSVANSEQVSSIQTLGDTVAEISHNTGENAQRAGKAAQLTADIRGKAENGSRQMDQMLHAVQDINDASTKIESVMKAIDDIAFQTNILALNAAVEAARAGSHGKGFAVVADEVRNLAVKSAAAAKESGDMIHDTISRASLGNKIATETAQTLTEIVEGVNQSTTLIEEISRNTENQAAAIAQVTDSLSRYSLSVQNTSSLSEQTAAASQQMSSQSVTLTDLVGRFHLRAQEPLPVSGSEDLPEPYGMTM